jgi:hypothetical protein
MQKHPLKYPIKIGKATIDQLTFRDYATANDLLAFDEHGATKQTIALIANLTDTDEAIIGRLHVTDFRKADAIASALIKPEATEKNEAES